MNMLATRQVFEPLKIWKELNDWDGIYGSFFPMSKNSTPIDVTENQDHYCIKADVPGFDKEDIKISLDDNILTIQGERKKETTNKQENYIQKERFYTNFSKSIALYDNVDIEKINASLKNGVLELQLPKKEAQEKKIKKIEVQ